ncbi:MAG TPA: ABC transporter permease [Candidatus Binatia bacterium]|nr:ABC transporter permease [Candidatus Binatia bacterium]
MSTIANARPASHTLHDARLDRRYWNLIVQFALKDFKIRYTHSVLGYAWSVLNPLIFAVLYYLVFSVFIRFNVPNYPGYLILGIVMWNFFAEGTSNGVSSLLNQAGIVTKAALPRQVIVYAAVLNALLTFAITMVVLLVVLRLTGTHLTSAVLVFPLVLLDLVLITVGISLLLAPLHVRYHDIGYLWGVALQIGFWLTPIVYHDLMIPPRWHWLLRFNPIARIVGHSRDALVYGTWPDWVVLARTSAIALALALLGTLVFRRMQERLVEYF